LLGVVALVLIVAGLMLATAPIFVALAGVIVLLWLVSTLRHLMDGTADVLGHPAVS
jgi:hypothetical protein